MAIAMTPEEIDHARRQVVMDLTIAQAEERRAEVLAEDLATALRKAEEAMQRAEALRGVLESEGVDVSGLSMVDVGGLVLPD
jgi:hypothetical protein